MKSARRKSQASGRPQKKIWMTFGAFLLVLIGVLSACSLDSSSPENQNKNEAQKVNDQQAHYASTQPVPYFNYSLERAVDIQIYIARQKAVDTWTVVYNYGNPIFSCASKGFPIPYTDQLTNPEAVDEAHNYTNWGATLPQAEPNGLYTGNTSATFVLCIRQKPGGGTELVPEYFESDVQTFSHPIKIVNGMVVDAGGNSGTQVTIDQNAADSNPTYKPTPTK